jgi:hypothetical protein
MVEKSARRMPLRQLLTHSEKCSRDLIEQLRAALGPSLSELRELSRPVRRRSSYPTIATMRNALRKIQQAHEEMTKLAEYLMERLQEIRRHGARH